MNRNREGAAIANRYGVIGLLTLFIALCAAVTARADDNLCVPYPTFNLVPTIDGVTDGDAGWREASQYVFNNGSTDPHAVVQLTRTGTDFYVSFEVNNDPTFDANDVIVLILRPDTNRANDRRLLIFPVQQNAGNAENAPGGPPREVKYWRNSNSWNNTAEQTKPAWLYNAATSAYTNNIKITSSKNVPGNKTYIVELRIPISTNADNGVNLPSGNFGLYFNIVRVDSSGSSEAPLSALGEMYWPLTAPAIGGSGLPPATPIGVANHTPDASTNTSAWPLAQSMGTCPGVKVTKVETNHPTDPNGIDRNSTNNLFNITITNTGTANASNVTALLRSSKFGIANGLGYGLVPPGVPTPASGVLAPGASTTLVYGPWDIPNDPNRNTYQSWYNVCSFVELNSTAGGTLIANRYFYWNLHFSPASRFSHTAVIDSRGFAPPPDGGPHRLSLMVNSREHTFAADNIKAIQGDDRISARTAARPFLSPSFDARQRQAALLETLVRYFPAYAEEARKKGTISVLTHTVHGYLAIGKFIEIEGVRYPIREPVNSYTYVLYHGGQVKNWATALSGAGIAPDGKLANRYVAVVQPNSEIAATTTAEPRERGSGICNSLSFADAGLLGGGLMLAGVWVFVPWRRRGRNEQTSKQ